MKLRHACRENIAVLACSCAANGLHWTTASNRLIPSGDRSPRSPEVTRTPSGRQTRGRFVFGVCKGYPCIERRLRNSFRPEASGCLRPKQGRGCDRRKCAASRCFGAGCAKTDTNRLGLKAHTYCRLTAAGNQEHRTNRPQRRGLKSHPVRTALPAAYAGVCKAVFHNDDVSSAVEQQPHGCWSLVRIRHVSHWIAQMGRASDC